MSRYTIDIGPKFDAVLTELANDADTTKSEAIRQSVALTNYVHKHMLEHPSHRLSITTKDGTVIKDIVMPILSQADGE